MKKFQQFVTDKDKGKAPVKKIADYVGDTPKIPPSGGAPYAATGKGGKPVKGAKVGSDWTDKGDKKLIYEPKTDQCTTDKNGEAKCVDTVKEFVERTKGLGTAEFAKYLASSSKDSGEVHESIGQTCRVLSGSPAHAGDLVRELKRAGLLRHVVAECLLHQEGYDAIADAMADSTCGQGVCRRLVRAMDEMVGPPMHHGMNRHPNASLIGMGDKGMMGDPHTQPGPGQQLLDDDEDDDDIHHGMNDFDDNEDIGIDDEDMDGQGISTAGNVAPPNVGSPRHPHFRSNAPRPSMMSRMMSRESHSLASDNFRKALRS